MFIFFKIYPKSVLASILSISGSLMLAFGIYAIYTCFAENVFLLQVFLVPVAVGLLFLAKRINDKAVEKKVKKSFNDPQLINTVKNSAVASYSLYKNAPCAEMLDFIRTHNVFAAEKISDIIMKRSTEERAVSEMRAYDSIGNIQPATENTTSKDVIYKNSLFTINGVETAVEEYNAKQGKLTKKIRNRKIAMIVFAVIFAFGAVLTAVNSSKKEEKEITPYSDCVPGDYTAVDVASLREYKAEDEFVFYYFTAADGTEGEVKLSVADSQLPQIQNLVDSQGATEPVRIYGNYVKYDAEGYVNGTYFTMPMYRINGSLEPQTEISSEFSSSVMMLCFGFAGLFVSYFEWKEKKKKLETLKNRADAMQNRSPQMP